MGGDLLVHSCLNYLVDKEEVTTSPRRKTKNLDLIVDLNLVTGKRVEFLWPTTSVPILRAYADTEQRIHIEYEDLSEILAITGAVKVRGGEILYFKRNFYLKEGTILFKETEARFDPVLTARAELREVSDVGEQVKIYLVVENEPLSRFSPRFESEPILPDSDILALLGANIYSELGGDSITISSAAALAGDLVGQFSLIRVFEQRIKDIFNLDLFSVRTEIIQTLLREQIFATAEDPVYPESSALGRYLDNTTIFLGKYFGNDIFLEAMFRINANTRLITGYAPSETFSIDSELSLEWKTPLFLLDITYAPDLSKLSETYLNFSLGLSWGYSF